MANKYTVVLGDAGINAIIQGWIEANKDQVGQGKQFKNFADVKKWFEENNTFRHPVTGKPCKLGDMPPSGPLLKPHDVINTPEGNAINKVMKLVGLKCEEPEPRSQFVTKPPLVHEEIPTPPPVVRVDVEKPAPTPLSVRMPGQVLLNTQGQAHEGVLFDRVSALLGEPPNRSTATYKSRPDTKRDDMRPGHWSGTRVDVAGEPATGAALGYHSPSVEMRNGRTDPGWDWFTLWDKPSGELPFTVQQSYEQDNAGQPMRPNMMVYQKIEDYAGVVRNAMGVWEQQIRMGATISKAARYNPYDGNRLREQETASTLRENLLYSTAEGLGHATAILGFERGIAQVEHRMKQNPTAADAKRLVEYYIQYDGLAVVRSQHSFGLPVMTPAGIRSGIENAIAAVPNEAEKAQLRRTYEPYIAALGSDNLYAVIESKGGLEGLANPLAEWGATRLDHAFVRDGLGHNVPNYINQQPYPDTLKDPENRKENERLGNEEAVRNMNIATRELRKIAVRPFTPTEIEYAAGVTLDTRAQDERNLSSARADLAETIATDPHVRSLSMEYLANTPGALHPVTQMMHTVSNRSSINYRNLGYPDADSARDGVKQMASDMFGEELGEYILKHEPGLLERVGLGAVRMVTLGFVEAKEKEDQIRGTYGWVQGKGWVNYEDVLAERLRNPETSSKAEAAYAEFARRTADVQRAGNGVDSEFAGLASTYLAKTFDPNAAEDKGPEAVARLAALRAALPAHLQRVGTDAMIAQQGNETGSLMRATQERIARGEVLPVSRGRMQALIAAQARGESLSLTEEERARVSPQAVQAGHVTVTSIPAASVTALASGMGVTTSNPNLVSPEVMRASFVEASVQRSPEVLATLVTSALAAAEKSGDSNAALALRTHLDSLKGGGWKFPAGQGLEELVSEQVQAVNAATDPVAALQAATAKFTAFFAGKNADGTATRTSPIENGIAATQLASWLKGDPKAVASVTAPVQAALAALEASPAATAKLKAVMALDPQERAAALMALDESTKAHMQAFMGGLGISPLEIAKMAILFWPRKSPPEQPPEQPLNRGEVAHCCKVAPEVPPLTPPPPPVVPVTPPPPPPPPVVVPVTPPPPPPPPVAVPPRPPLLPSSQPLLPRGQNNFGDPLTSNTMVAGVTLPAGVAHAPVATAASLTTADVVKDLQTTVAGGHDADDVAAQIVAKATGPAGKKPTQIT